MSDPMLPHLLTEINRLRDLIDSERAENDLLHARAHELAALRDRIQAVAEGRVVEIDRLREALRKARECIADAWYQEDCDAMPGVLAEIDRELEGRE